MGKTSTKNNPAERERQALLKNYRDTFKKNVRSWIQEQDADRISQALVKFASIARTRLMDDLISTTTTLIKSTEVDALSRRVDEIAQTLSEIKVPDSLYRPASEDRAPLSGKNVLVEDLQTRCKQEMQHFFGADFFNPNARAQPTWDASDDSIAFQASGTCALTGALFKTKMLSPLNDEQIILATIASFLANPIDDNIISLTYLVKGAGPRLHYTRGKTKERFENGWARLQELEKDNALGELAKLHIKNLLPLRDDWSHLPDPNIESSSISTKPLSDSSLTVKPLQSAPGSYAAIIRETKHLPKSPAGSWAAITSASKPASPSINTAAVVTTKSGLSPGCRQKQTPTPNPFDDMSAPSSWDIPFESLILEGGRPRSVSRTPSLTHSSDAGLSPSDSSSPSQTGWSHLPPNNNALQSLQPPRAGVMMANKKDQNLKVTSWAQKAAAASSTNNNAGKQKVPGQGNVWRMA